MSERITLDNFTEKAIQSEKPVIVDFYSDSCIPCKRLAPVLADAEERFRDRLIVYKVNSNFDTELVEKYGITANPTLLFLKNGKEVDRSTGILRPDELTEWINKNL